MFTPLVATEEEAVIKNLVTAFEEEMKAHSACRAFAVQAEGEGLHGRLQACEIGRFVLQRGHALHATEQLSHL